MRLLAGLALIAGCYHQPAAPPAQPVSQPEAPTKHARTATDRLGFLPADADVLASIDTASLRGTPLWSRVEPGLLTRAAPVLDQFRLACGFDPVPQIEHVAIAMRNLDTPQLEGVVVIAGLSRPQLMGCMNRAIKQTPTLARVERNVVLVTDVPGEKPVAFAFADARTVVIIVGPRAATAQGVRDVLDAGAPLRGNTLFMDLFNRVDLRRHAWLYLNGAAKLFDGVGALGIHPRAVFAAIDAPGGAIGKVHVRMPDPTEATKLVAMVQAQITAVQALVEKFEVTSDDDVVVVDLVVTEDQLMLGASLLGP